MSEPEDTCRAGGDLTINQLRWLRQKVPAFAEAQDRVVKSDLAAQRIRQQLEDNNRAA